MKIRKTTKEERETNLCNFTEIKVKYRYRRGFLRYLCDRPATYKVSREFRCGLHLPSKKCRTRILRNVPENY